MHSKQNTTQARHINNEFPYQDNFMDEIKGFMNIPLKNNGKHS